MISVEKVYSVAISQNMKYLVSGSKDKSIKIFNFAQRKELFHFQNAHDGSLWGLWFNPNPGEIRSVAITWDNKYIVSGSFDNSIKIFDIENKKEVYHFKNIHEGKFEWYLFII